MPFGQLALSAWRSTNHSLFIYKYMILYFLLMIYTIPLIILQEEISEGTTPSLCNRRCRPVTTIDLIIQFLVYRVRLLCFLWTRDQSQFLPVYVLGSISRWLTNSTYSAALALIYSAPFLGYLFLEHSCACSTLFVFSNILRGMVVSRNFWNLYFIDFCSLTWLTIFLTLLPSSLKFSSVLLLSFLMLLLHWQQYKSLYNVHKF